MKNVEQTLPLLYVCPISSRNQLTCKWKQTFKAVNKVTVKGA